MSLKPEIHERRTIRCELELTEPVDSSPLDWELTLESVLRLAFHGHSSVRIEKVRDITTEGIER